MRTSRTCGGSTSKGSSAAVRCLGTARSSSGAGLLSRLPSPLPISNRLHTHTRTNPGPSPCPTPTQCPLRVRQVRGPGPEPAGAAAAGGAGARAARAQGQSVRDPGPENLKGAPAPRLRCVSAEGVRGGGPYGVRWGHALRLRGESGRPPPRPPTPTQNHGRAIPRVRAALRLRTNYYKAEWSHMSGTRGGPPPPLHGPPLRAGSPGRGGL